MGFWQGANEGLTYVLEKKAAQDSEDKMYAFKREEYQKTLLENRRERYLQIAAKRAETEGVMAAEINTAISLGLTDTTALALQNSGQLGLFLDQYDKNKRVDPEFVKDLNLTVTKYLKEAGDEAISTAMVNGVSTGRDTRDPEESSLALVEAIYSATTPEQMDEISRTIYASPAATAIAPFQLDFGYASGPEEAETKAMRNEIASALQSQFTDSFIVNERTGDITIAQNADRSVANLYALAEERARDMAFGPLRAFSPTNAAAYVTKQIRTAVTTGGLGAKDIFENFDRVLMDPVTFATNFRPVPPPDVVPPPVTLSPQGQIGSIGDSLSTNTFGDVVDAYGRPTQ
jgi:hypothetical protein